LPILYNIYSEYVMRLVLEEWKGGVSIGGKKISNLRNADDILLIAGSEAEYLELLKLESVSQEYGLKINKTKVMIIDHAERKKRTNRLETAK